MESIRSRLDVDLEREMKMNEELQFLIAGAIGSAPKGSTPSIKAEFVLRALSEAGLMALPMKATDRMRNDVAIALAASRMSGEPSSLTLVDELWEIAVAAFDPSQLQDFEEVLDTLSPMGE